MATITSREFNQDVSGAKRRANEGPVIITDRGVPAYVLLKHDDYRSLTGNTGNICDLLAMPGIEDIDFEPVRLGEGIFVPADFS